MRFLVGLILATTVLAAPVNKSRLRGVAVEGHDVVAYFTQGAAVEGSGDFEHAWSGATWRFSSALHRDQFAADPERYAPQYGGFCAYGVSRGYAVGVDPEAWFIDSGKLYLNYNLQVRARWLADPAGFIAKADAAWPAVAAKTEAK